jgi:hypothetical protein
MSDTVPAQVVCVIHVDCPHPSVPHSQLRAGDRYMLRVLDAEQLVELGKATPDHSVEPVLDAEHPNAADLLAHLDALVPVPVPAVDFVEQHPEV